MSHNPYRWTRASCSQPGQPGMPQMPPQGYGNQYSHFNPNAAAFIPRTGGGQGSGYGGPGQGSAGYGGHSSQNQFDHYAPSYANAPMYGSGHDVPHQYYQNDYQAPPAMTSYYSDDGYGGYDQFGYQPTQQYVPSVELQERIQKSENPFEVQEIIVGLEQLLQGGEDFNVWAGAIRDRLSAPMVPDNKILAIAIACEMAVVVSPQLYSQTDHQPQYIFAKLIGFIASEIKGFTPTNVLPNLEALHTTYGQMNPEKKANLLMFFAELYNRLETEVGGKKIAALGDAVIMQMNECLKTPTDDSMKLLIHVLKLAGPDLDSTPKGYEQMNDLLTRVTGYATGHPKLSESVKAQMLDVVDHRTKGWGGHGSNAIMGANGSSVLLTEDEEAFLDDCIGDSESSSLNQTLRNDPDTSLDEADVMNEYNSFVQEEDEKLIEAKDAELMNMMNELKVESKTPTDEPSSPSDPPAPSS